MVGTTVSFIGAIVLLACIPIFAHSADDTIPYQGTALGDTALYRIRSLVSSVDGLAVKIAEEQTGFRLDPSRLRLVLVDVPVGLTTFHSSMRTSGYDTVTISVLAQFWLRSAGKDSTAALQTLTHEYVHAILRQNMQAEHYKPLPKWFKEGLAVYIAGQHLDKLWVALARNWQNPESMYEGLEDRSTAGPYLIGSWWFTALEKNYGPDTTQLFLDALVREHNLYDASVALGCDIEEVWRMAELSAESEVQDSMDIVGALLRDCLYLRSDEPDQCRKCLGKLIKGHPDTYAAEYSLYWAAKLSYQQQYVKDAREYLERLSSCRRDYGFGDNSLYLHLKIAIDSNQTEEAGRYCEEYFTLWPDGNYWGRVQLMCQELH